MNSLGEIIQQAAAWSLHTTVETALPAVVVLVLARLRWLPPRWSIWLSAFVLLRLLMPAVPGLSWHPAVAYGMEQSAAAAPVAEFASMSDADEATLSVPAAASATSDIDVSMMLPWLWLAGFLAVMGWVLWSRLQLHFLLRRAAPIDARIVRLWDECRALAGCRLKVPVRMVPDIPTVAVHGFLRPLLLAPADLLEKYTADELRGMFAHELAHIRRHDVLWTWLGLIACALHWFNPLAWLAFRRFRHERELLCDEAAIDVLGHASRRRYGGTLIKLLASEDAPSSSAIVAPFFRTPAELQHRIQMIANPTRIKSWSRLVALLVVPSLALLILTTARADREPDGDKPERAEESRDRESTEKKPAEREGESEKRGPRDGEREKTGPRDGERESTGPKDGEGERKTGPRDGEGEKKGERDGDRPRDGERDGEKKKMTRDGQGEGDDDRPREGEKKKMTRDGESQRDGERKTSREGDGEKRMPREGEGDAPRKTTGEKAPPPAGIVVSLDAEGNVVASDGRIVPTDTVRTKLQALAQQNPDQTVTLRSTAGTPIEKVMAAMQVMKDSGIKNVTLGATR